MESHEKWGLGFILFGILMAVHRPLWISALISILLGASLFVFGGREKKIEEVKE